MDANQARQIKKQSDINFVNKFDLEPVFEKIKKAASQGANYVDIDALYNKMSEKEKKALEDLGYRYSWLHGDYASWRCICWDEPAKQLDNWKYRYLSWVFSPSLDSGK